MNETEKKKIDYLKSVTTKTEYRHLLEGLKIAVGEGIKLGMSISASKKEFEKVLRKIKYLTEHPDRYVRGTANNIIEHAKEKSRQGIFGDGVFIMD